MLWEIQWRGHKSRNFSALGTHTLGFFSFFCLSFDCLVICLSLLRAESSATLVILTVLWCNLVLFPVHLGLQSTGCSHQYASDCWQGSMAVFNFAAQSSLRRTVLRLSVRLKIVNSALLQRIFCCWIQSDSNSSTAISAQEAALSMQIGDCGSRLHCVWAGVHLQQLWVWGAHALHGGSCFGRWARSQPRDLWILHKDNSEA